MSLAAPLSAEDCCVQSMPDASPLKWHLAHTSWFFETFILERFEPGFRSHHPAFRMLFNSYYNGIGEKHPRAQRGMITRPSHAEVLAYRNDIDCRVAALLADDRQGEDGGNEGGIAHLVSLGLQHEQQHQELMLTDLLHLLSQNPLQPAYQKPATPTGRDKPGLHAVPQAAWLQFKAGIVWIGNDGQAFCFDNETPRHRQFVEPFALATALVTNGEFRAFVEDGGYEDPAYWLSEGWDWVTAQKLRHPLYWMHDAANGWREFTLQGVVALDTRAPLAHVSLFEADAYARWAVASCEGNGGDDELTGVYDSCWQWTTSSYAPYPGYAAAAGALGEYNGKFMINQYVLRGGSSATPIGHTRRTYRNFFPASSRWQFSGIRLARSLPQIS